MPELMTHTIVLGLSIAAIVIMASVLNVVRTDSQQGTAQALTENVCAQLKLAAEQLRPSSQPATVKLVLPDRIGGAPYSIGSSGRTITVTSVNADHSCIVGTNAQLSGTASGGAALLTLYADTITLSNT